ncbi:MAG: CoA transferase [Pseudomonadales bacterium]|jgi:2-methylfumaryl-CoA isomerase|nr:CoA transferase [Pseudomonadales bacterium]
MKGILSGMTVVEGSAFIAAPLGGMTLAQLGARVIRFDPIGGGLDYHRWPVTAAGTSLFWAGMNKGKQSIQLDIRKPEGREIITALLSRPGPELGMFLTNFPERGWLAYDELRKLRQDLIYVNVLGDRQGGSALDYTINCAVGFTNATGPVDSDHPTNYLLPAWDNITGQMTATALLAAERYRYRSGQGQLVRIALKDVALATAGHLGNISEVMINKHDRERVGNYLYGAFGRDFVSKDGKRLMIVGLTPKQWSAIQEATETRQQFESLRNLKGLKFDSEGDRFENRQDISAILEPWFGRHEYALIKEKFDQTGVCYGPYRSFREMVAEDPDCSEDNPLFQMVEQPEIGTYLVPSSPIRFTESANLPALKAPILGEHTDQILAEELGFSSAEIGRLHDDNIVA